MTATTASILAAFLPTTPAGDHGPVTTTAVCEAEVTRVVSNGVTTYAVSGDVETEGVITGPYRVAVNALKWLGCPCPDQCMIEVDHDLDFQAGLTDR